MGFEVGKRYQFRLSAINDKIYTCARDQMGQKRLYYDHKGIQYSVLIENDVVSGFNPDDFKMLPSEQASTDLKVYTYRFKGKALGGHMTVVAKSLLDADTMATEYLKKQMSNETLLPSLTSNGVDENMKLSSNGGVVFFDDGDY